ncbi:unnamed protein product [Rhizophagus irregularis]|nr:unnamed protein product [Rhizophagus irregularis]
MRNWRLDNFVFFQEVDETIVSSEPFPGEMLTPCKNRVALPDDIYQILTEYYNIAYDLQFVTIAETTSTSSRDAIVVKCLDQHWHPDT